MNSDATIFLLSAWKIMPPFVIIMSNSPVKMWQQEKMWHPFVDQLVISVKENGYNGVKTDKKVTPVGIG